MIVLQKNGLEHDQERFNVLIQMKDAKTVKECGLNMEEEIRK
jgi:hypothetical protein